MQIKKSEIHIWIAKLDESFNEEESALLVLNIEELKRAKRFHFPIHRQRFIAARSILRYILSKYINIPAKKIIFAYNEYGKPYLQFPADTALHFNLSHAENMAIYAFSLDHPLGVDIEHSNINCPIEIAKRYFSPQEQAELADCQAADKINGFYRIWTRKEAIIKALGKGMSISLPSFSVSLRNEKEIITLDNQPWSLLSLCVHEDYPCALAINQPLEKIHIVYHPYQLGDFLT